jgi:hypothetical protein
MTIARGRAFVIGHVSRDDLAFHATALELLDQVMSLLAGTAVVGRKGGGQHADVHISC